MPPSELSDPALDAVGSRLRQERERRHIGVRELARRISVSPSLISQIELGRASPSVGTLYAITNELEMSLDELFAGEPAAPPGVASAPDLGAALAALDRAGGPLPAAASAAEALEPVVRRDERLAIELGTGVRWERMNPRDDRGVDFLHVVYDVGGASCEERQLMRHAGREYGTVLRGRLGVTVGFDTYTLEPGDSISFDSTTPHRLYTIGDERVEAVWIVLGRHADARLGA